MQEAKLKRIALRRRLLLELAELSMWKGSELKAFVSAPPDEEHRGSGFVRQVGEEGFNLLVEIAPDQTRAMPGQMVLWVNVNDGLDSEAAVVIVDDQSVIVTGDLRSFGRSDALPDLQSGCSV